MLPENEIKETWVVEDHGYTTPCWMWTGAKSSYGYGRKCLPDRRMINAHRWVYEQLVGPIPEGLELDHLCRVRRCVNPDHVEPTTHRVNCLRGEGAPAQNARKTHCKRGHPLSGENLYLDPRGHRECRMCRRENWRLWHERNGVV